ncbi:MAG: hypothetical protein R2932_27715 [Caldilineaceae bacterium]
MVWIPAFLDEAPLRLFIMGSNEWRNEQEWPLARTEGKSGTCTATATPIPCGGDGALAPTQPAAEPTDHFVYDPHYPVQTNGGNNCCAPHITPWGPYDQRAWRCAATCSVTRVNHWPRIWK